MSLSIDLPAEALDRVRAEAERRGSTVDEVIAELTEQLPGASQPSPRGRIRFIGAGASAGGRVDPVEDLLARGFGLD